MAISLTLPARTLWEQLVPERDHYLRRAEDVASLTIPYLAPPGSHNKGTEFTSQSLPTPFQSIGRRGINNVAAKFLLTLLPPGHSMFRLALDKFKFAAEFGEDGITDAEAALVTMETAIHTEITNMGLRPVAYQAYRNLCVAGNGIIKIPDEGAPTFIPLSRYVLKRDPEDNLMVLLFREEIAYSMLPKEVQAVILSDHQTAGMADDTDIAHKNIIVFTRVQRLSNGRFAGWQELENGGRIPGTEGAWDSEDLPWLPLRWERIDGESYGRGLGEEVLGDLRSVEGLSEAIVNGAAAAAHHIWLVNPNGRTQIRDVAGAPTGAYRSGNPEDIKPLKLEKNADFAFASNTAQEITRRLEHAFLLATSVQRNADRVTAAEFRTLVNELNETLGGVFSIQDTEFQQPLVARTKRRLEKRGSLPPTPEGLVTPQIITGIEGLGRNQEGNRLRAALGDINETLGPEGFGILDKREVVDRLLNSAGVTSEGLVLSEEDIQAQQQADQQMALAERAAPNIATQVGRMAQDPTA